MLPGDNHQICISIGNDIIGLFCFRNHSHSSCQNPGLFFNGFGKRDLISRKYLILAYIGKSSAGCRNEIYTVFFKDFRKPDTVFQSPGFLRFYILYSQ